MTIDPAMLLVLRGALCALFVTTATHKLRDVGAFHAAVQGYRLLPQDWTLPAAAGLIAVEAGLAVALWLPGVAPVAALAAAALLLLYAAAIQVNLRRGRHHLDCGCSGAAQRQPIRAALVVRNAGLALAAVAAALPAGDRGLAWLDAVTIAGAVAVLALLYVAADGLLAGAPRLAHLRRLAALEAAHG